MFLILFVFPALSLLPLSVAAAVTAAAAAAVCAWRPAPLEDRDAGPLIITAYAQSTA